MLSRSPASCRRRRLMSTHRPSIRLRGCRGHVQGVDSSDRIACRVGIDAGDRGARAHWLRFTDDAHDVGGRAAGQPIRQPAGEQLVEQNAERVDVGCRGDGVATDLLGAGVLGGHQLLSGGSWREGLARELRVQQLGDPEVQQLGCAVGGHQHVGGLDVTVDDQVLVCVLHGGADLSKELQARGGVEPVCVAVLHDRLPFDELHRKVRSAVAACCRRRAVRRYTDARGSRGSAARGGSGGRCCRCPCRA